MKATADPAVITYHALDDSGSVISTSPDVFARQMKYLAESGRTVVPLADVFQVSGAISLTFDDGFQSFHKHALPLLDRYRFPATLFVVAGRCGLDNRWPGSSDAVPTAPLMNWREVREAAGQGVTIGSHTLQHRDLTRLSLSEAESEMVEGRNRIEQELGRPAEEFAYPYGAANNFVRNFAERHFDLACGTELNFASPGADRWLLPRIDAYYLRNPRCFQALVDGRAGAYVSFRRWLRRLRTWA